MGEGHWAGPLWLGCVHLGPPGQSLQVVVELYGGGPRGLTHEGLRPASRLCSGKYLTTPPPGWSRGPGGHSLGLGHLYPRMALMAPRWLQGQGHTRSHYPSRPWEQLPWAGATCVPTWSWDRPPRPRGAGRAAPGLGGGE